MYEVNDLASICDCRFKRARPQRSASVAALRLVFILASTRAYARVFILAPLRGFSRGGSGGVHPIAIFSTH